MPWLQAHIFCRDDIAELMGEQLLELGAQSVSFFDAADQPIYEPKPGTTPGLWQETKVTGLFDLDYPEQQLIQLFKEKQAQGQIKSFELEHLADQDWVRLSLENFKPLLIGKRLCICPSWIPMTHPGRVTVTLDPGLAFGTGTHPTTALCLEWLEKSTRSFPLVIDYGCGSGILGIAALKLGAEKVIAIDHDPQALMATQANSESNQITFERLVTAHPEAIQSAQADLIIANILAQPLIELAPLFFKLLKNNGIILISGILEQQVPKVVEIYQAWFNIELQNLKDGWVCIEAKKENHNSID